MRKLLSVIVLLAGFSSLADQIVLRVPNEDFNPLKTSMWKIMAGNSTISLDENNIKTSASGLSLSVERNIWRTLDLGAQFGVLKTTETEIVPNAYYNQQTGLYENGYETINDTATILSGYGKLAFVNMPINKWNLLQVNLIGGIEYRSLDKVNNYLIYGASVSYNYDNVLGIELGSKVNLKAENLITTNLIGYF